MTPLKINDKIRIEIRSFIEVIMNLEGILLEYGKSKNIGRLRLDSTGVCNILVNDEQIVTFEKSLDREGFFVYSAIGIIPPGEEKELALSILQANLFGKETGHANIGYVEQTRTLVLFEYFDENGLEYSRFHQRFNKYIQYLFYWLVKLKADESLSNKPQSIDVPFDQMNDKDKKIFYA